MYDVVVIGCGPGGYAATIRACQLGGRTALVEDSDIGGTCVNRGCIPSKIWLHGAHLFSQMKQAEAFGLKYQVQGIDLSVLVNRKNQVAADIRKGMEALLAKKGVELIRGRATVAGPGKVQVNARMLETRNIIMATGSSLNVPEIPGLKDVVLTSDQILDLTQTPDSVLIWGEGGPIEVELAALLNAFGSKVHLATFHDRILHREDHGTSQRLAQVFREQGIHILSRSTLEKVDKTLDAAEVRFANNAEPIKVTRVVVALRRPNTSDQGFDKLGLRLNDDGGVWVDDRLQTSLPGLYAVGDMVGGWMNSHAASAMGVTAAENAMGQHKNFSFHLIPRGIWTFPQVGAVGLSEEEAEAKGFNVKTGSCPYTINGLALSTGEVDGAVKVVWDGDTQDVLGVHIVGTNATEVVGEAVMALQLECTINELAHTMRVHPTMSEALMEAGRNAANWALYLP